MVIRVLVTPRSLTEQPHPAIEAMGAYGVDVVYSSAGKTPSEEELLKLVPDIAGWIAGVEPVSESVIAAANNLRCISRNGTGFDNLPIATLKSRNIDIRLASGANAQGVAELAMALMFAALRHVAYSDNGMKSGAWLRKRGIELRGRKLGVIGCGAVGREVARACAAMGALILAHDPMTPNLHIDNLRWVELEELFRESDIITLHCPPPSNGQCLVDQGILEKVHDGLILINTARSSLIDEVALIVALDSGKIATYCTDVYDQEPPQFPGLASRSDVIATSHIGGYTEESVTRATEFAVANLLDSLGIKENAA